MNIYTSYFSRLKEIEAAGLMPVGIAVRPPAFFKGNSLSFFAPRLDMLRLSPEKYEKEFKAILSRLKPEEVKERLTMLMNYFKKDIVLLCFEKDWNECHRKMVAEWLNENCGYSVSEWKVKKEVVSEHKKEVQGSLF